MSTYEEAEDCFVSVRGVQIAFRRLGLRHGVPLLHLSHFRGTMDHVDPIVANQLAAKRPLILFDNNGIGRSHGEVPQSFREAAQNCAAFVATLSLEQVDVWGLSMGGCVAQMLALDYPSLVRRLVLCGAMPSIGRGVTPPPAGPFRAVKWARTQQEHRAAFLEFCFHKSSESQSAGRMAWKRIVEARNLRCENVGTDGTRRQVISFAKFMDPKYAHDGSFDRLHELRIPVLVVKGSDDIVLSDHTCRAMMDKLCNTDAKLHVFPDAGHACHNQYPQEFSQIVNEFLDSEVFTTVQNDVLGVSKLSSMQYKPCKL